jgi:hypothetical protein
VVALNQDYFTLNSASIQALKVYPGLAAEALRRGHARGLAVWHIARALSAGSGRVSFADLQAACNALGLEGDRGGRFVRALDQAKDAGMICEVTRRRDGARVLEIRSTLKVAQSYNLESIGARPVLVPSEKVARLKDWRAALFATFLEGARSDRTKSNPIAQSTLRALTSVPERTQRNYNALAGVTVRRNIAVTGRLAEYNGHWTPAMIEAMENHGGTFMVNDKSTGTKLVAWSLPASYFTDLERTKRGRNRKINSTLKGGLVIDAAGQHEKGKTPRVFWDRKEIVTDKIDGTKAGRVESVEETQRRAVKHYYDNRTGQAKSAPRDLYVHSHIGERSGAGIWRVV